MNKQFVVWAVPNHSDEFEVSGIFTKADDAETFVRECEQSGGYLSVAPPECLEMPVILDLLVRDRLRELADPIDRLAKSMQSSGSAAEGG